MEEEEESERRGEKRSAAASSLLFSLFLRVHKTSCTFSGRPHRELVDVGNNADDSEDNFGRGVHVQN